MKKPEKCARTIFFDFKRYFEISVLEVPQSAVLLTSIAFTKS